MSDTYMTHVCRLPQNIGNLEKMEKNTETFSRHWM